jgi:hypothetical protein
MAEVLRAVELGELVDMLKQEAAARAAASASSSSRSPCDARGREGGDRGFDGSVSNRIACLSTGERQRLCLARLLYQGLCIQKRDGRPLLWRLEEEEASSGTVPPSSAAAAFSSSGSGSSRSSLSKQFIYDIVRVELAMCLLLLFDM